VSGPGTTPLRDEIRELQHEVQVLFAAQRRLLWRSKRDGTAATPDRLQALIRLSEGETTHGQLVREVQMNPATVSALIDNLVARDLVQRRRDDQDGRVWWLSLTEKGQAEVDRLNANWVKLLESAFADVPDRDLQATRDVLARLTLLFDRISAQPDQAGEEAATLTPGAPAARP
jgi:DNA-binding MarR family transcriptional regulator